MEDIFDTSFILPKENFTLLESSGLAKRNTTIFHRHGTNDKTLPFSLINKPDKAIENGTHMMVYKKHEEISKIIL